MVSHEVEVKVELVKDELQDHSHGYWQDFPWAAGRKVSVSLATDWRTPQFLVTWISWQHGTFFPQSEWEREPNMEPTAFCNLISLVTSHHFCCVLFIVSKAVGPAQPQGAGTHTRRWMSRGGAPRSHVGGCRPHKDRPDSHTCLFVPELLFYSLVLVFFPAALNMYPWDPWIRLRVFQGI